MRNSSRLGAVFVVLLVLALGAGACRKTVTRPIYQRPAISSVVVFPTVLGPGDSTMITVLATDPNGDSLFYDWEAFNGLTIKGAPSGNNSIYNTRSRSMVFFRSPTWPNPTDTAFVWCTASDRKGGSDTRQVLVFYEN